MTFLIFSQVMRHPLTKLFHLSNLLQILNDRRMVDVEFFSNFLCCSKRISFNHALNWLLSASWWPATKRLIFKALVSFAKLEPPLHWTWAVPGPDALLMFQVASAALQPILNSNKKVTWICVLYNITFQTLFIFNWRIIALQNCVGFCQASTWISHRCTYSHHFYSLKYKINNK